MVDQLLCAYILLHPLIIFNSGYVMCDTESVGGVITDTDSDQQVRRQPSSGEVFAISIINAPSGEPTRMAYNNWDDRAGLRRYVRFNK